MNYFIQVPLVPPSPNNNEWRHHMAKSRLRQRWREELFLGVATARFRNELKALARKNKMRVEVTVHHAHITDDDNLVAGLKPVLDGLKWLGYIKDDSPEHLELVLPVAQVQSAEKKTIIKIAAQ